MGAQEQQRQHHVDGGDSAAAFYGTPRTTQPSCSPAAGAAVAAAITPSPQHRQEATHTRKTVYLIRHAESLAQVSPKEVRVCSKSLLDCGLTDPKGVRQAQEIRLVLGRAYDEIELVVTSPLTRAIQTALLAFSEPTRSGGGGARNLVPIVVHYDLREIGDATIPENVPRPMPVVLSELGINGGDVDYTSLQPSPDWPRRHDQTPRVVRKDRIRSDFCRWLASRPERVVAIVSHYNVIRAVLTNPYDSTSSAATICPRNGIPIESELLVPPDTGKPALRVRPLERLSKALAE